MKALFLTIILFLGLSTTFKPEPTVYLLGTFKLYVTEDGKYFVTYRGFSDGCFTRTMIMNLYHCDTFQLRDLYDNLNDVNRNLKLDTFPYPDTLCEIPQASKIKIYHI